MMSKDFHRFRITSMASFKLLLQLTAICFLCFSTTTEAQEQDTPIYLYKNCSSNQTTAGSAFQFNLQSLLSSLSSSATANNSDFYYATVASKNPSDTDTVYGLFMCRGDVPSSLCQQCVLNATQRLSSECSVSKEAVIWYDECMVRYSNRSFFSTVDRRPRLGLLNTANISNQHEFMALLFDTMNITADKAAYSPNKYATTKANISELQSLYCLAQCTQDLSAQKCRSCLSSVIGDLNWCCTGKQGGRVLYPSCNVRYELYPFYRDDVTPAPRPAPSGLVPETSTSVADSRYSEDPVYLNHNCSSNETFTVKSSFQSYLRTLLYYLSSNATSGRKPFKRDEVESVYGIFMCRGDLSPPLCGRCVINATDRISSECRFSKEAIIWYSHCFLRYSPRYIASQAERSPVFKKLNITNYSTQEQNSFTVTLSNTLALLANLTGDSDNRYETYETTLNPSQTLYTLAQCTPDLSSDDCGGCLQDVIGSAIPWAYLGSVGGRVLYPSCNLRFELFQFYRDGLEAQPPTTGSSSPSVPTTETG